MSPRAAPRLPGPLDQWLRDVATVVGLRPTAPIFAQRTGPRWPQASGLAQPRAARPEASRAATVGSDGPDAGARDIPSPIAAHSQAHHQGPARPEATSVPIAQALAHRVVIHLRGETYEVDVDDGQTLLEAARLEGVDLPFSCASGGCGACRVRLVAGNYEVEAPNCLSEGERAAGFVLACVGRPRSACRIEADA